MAGTEGFRLGYESCLKNAELWLNEGNTLWEKGSYGHACALYIHGLEGLMHTWYTWLVYIGAIEPDNKDFLDSFKQHGTKLRTFWGLIIGRQIEWDQIEVEPDFLEKEGIWKQFEQEQADLNIALSELSRDMMDHRNRAIYVNYDPIESTFTSPLNLTQADAGRLAHEIQKIHELVAFFIKSDDKIKSKLRKMIQFFSSS